MGLAELAASYVFLSTYVPACVFPCQTPRQRLLCALPAIALCLYIPSFVPWGIPRVVAGCITMWLSTFKLIAFVCNRGPMARPDLTMLQRTLLFLLPIHPRSPRWGKPPTVAWILVVLLGKVALQAVVALLLVNVQLHPFLVHSLWAVCIWNLVAMGVDIMVPFVQYVMGMPLNPSMNQPYLSVTIQEFWSQRYNLVTTTCLRQTIYEPVIDGAFVRPPSEVYARAGSTGPDAEAAISKDGAAVTKAAGRQLPDTFSEAMDLAHQVSLRRPAVGGGSASDGASAAGSVGSNSSTASDAGAGSDTDGSCDADAGAGGADASAAAGLRRRRAAGGAVAADALRGGGADQGTGKALAKAAAVAGGAAAAACAAKPVAPKPVAEWRKSLATFMVFFASGVMHEGLIWYMCNANGYRETGRYVFGPVMAFFCLQAPALQAEKMVLRSLSAAAARARKALGLPAPSPASTPSRPPPSTPAGRAAAAARRAAGATARAAWGAARVVMVYAWLWGLADFTFWKSTQSCHIEHYAIPEIMVVVDAIKAAAVRVAGALP